MNTIEYATFRYDTVEVENGLNNMVIVRYRSVRVRRKYKHDSQVFLRMFIS